MSDPQTDDASVRLDEAEAPQVKAARTPWYRSRALRWCSWAATAAVWVYALIRLFGLETGWILVTTIAFVPYVAGAALIGAGIQAALRHWRAAIVTVAAALAMAAVIAPRALPDEQPVAEGAELRVLSVNAYVGTANLEYIVELVDRYEPDLLSIQELTPGAYEELADLGLEERMPHVIAEPAELAVGTGLYSLHPLERLESSEPDGIFYQIAAEATLPDGSKARFMAVHTAAPARPERIPQWEADFAQLPRPVGDVPWVLAGDFNATLDHRLLREAVEWGYTDAAETTGEGLAATWRPIEGGYLGGFVRPPAVTLDHVLVDERIAVSDFEVLEKDGSDHAPVLATIRLPE
ncbi:endonuclease/exonuclease/phosphatase family protein [Glycomyces tenuis]|uniref:endonuclease/exonuclease/phosphatase family protein n=1 Tax=Glycomyces tenuis TaxID=58116 RepID=UPI0003FDE54E|nr:endonuclease/exonuclease/phosphatase family protein [Glycomyces tenuis]